LHSVTGLHCPGCGTTRSLHSLLNGHFTQSLAYNPLTLIVLPVVVLALCRSLWSWLWDAPLPRGRRVRPYLMWALLVVLLLFGVLRNVPYYPFTLLAPHELAG
jgi:heme A synthase